MTQRDNLGEVDEWARARRAFTFREIAESADPDSDDGALRSKLTTHPWIIRLRPGPGDPDFFVPDSVLFRWFATLNLRLARLEVFTLLPGRVGLAMSHLHPDARWDTPPAEAVQFGSRLGLIGVRAVGEDFVFPLARLLSRMRPGALGAAEAFLDEMGDNDSWRQPLRAVAAHFALEGFTDVPETTRWIVQARAGLLGHKPTLEQLGTCLDLTRERVRQIESQFFHGSSKSGTSWRAERRLRPFVCPLVADRMAESGSLVVDVRSSASDEVLLLAKCCGVPVAPIADTGLAVLAAPKQDVAGFAGGKWALPEGLNVGSATAKLECAGPLALIGSDVSVVASRIVERRRRHLRKSHKVYLALRSMGRPAHYSEVAREYARLWGEPGATDDSVHAVLGREEHGVVWVGVRGTFALKEWGYEHPAEGIFEAVTGIVRRKFEETGNPVSFPVITAEIGRYRKLVNQKSLQIAASCNAAVRRLPGDIFVPVEATDTQEQALSADKLDSVLQAFVEAAGSARTPNK